MNEHDQRFKRIIRELLWLFLEAFFPGEAARLDFSNVQWLEQEYYLDPPTGERRTIDLAARVLDRDQTVPGSATIVNVEPESGNSATGLPPRAFDYWYCLTRRYSVKVLTVGLFLNLALKTRPELKHTERTGSRQDMRFRFPCVGLSGLEASAHVNSDNAVAVAFACLMRIEPGQRARMKADILRRLTELPLNEYRQMILTECVERYLQLDAAEQAEFEQLTRTEAYQMIEEFKHPWVERAEQRGRLNQTRDMLIALGTSRFGKPDPGTEQTLATMQNIDTLQDWFNRALQAASWADVVASPAKANVVAPPTE